MLAVISTLAALAIACGGGNDAAATATATAAATTAPTSTPATAEATSAAAATATPTATRAPQRTAQEILSFCPCRTRNLDLFYGEVPASTPLPAGVTLEELIASQLRDYETILSRRGGQQLAARGLRLLDDPDLIARVSDIRLRMALGLSLGTAVEPIIASIIEGDIIEVAFREVTDDTVAYVESFSDGTSEMVISLAHQFDHPAALAGTMAHEALHTNPEGAGREEEATAFLINTYLTAEMIRDFPELLAMPTALLQEDLDTLLGLGFNSDTVFDSRGDLVVSEAEDFFESLRVDYGYEEDYETPGSRYLRAILDNLGVAPDIRSYSRSLLSELDLDRIIDHEGFLEPEDLITLAELLDLDLLDALAAAS